VPEANVFAPPQPFPSWSLNNQTGEWEAPTPKPEIPSNYDALWDEENQEWDVFLREALS
jgi:hypothetical protein